MLGALKENEWVRAVYGYCRYRVGHPPYFADRIRLDLDGVAPFELDARFGVNRYDRFGEAHNRGFRRWLEACRGKRTVFDVGAHIGLYAVTGARAMGPGGTLVAFEPASANLHFLRRHLALNRCGRVRVEPVLVGDQEIDAVEFFASPRPDPMNALVNFKERIDYQRQMVRQITLDEYCRAHGLAPDLVKIDVEGAEARVIRGFQKTLRRHRPRVFLSVHPRRITRLNDSLPDLLAQLDGLGYDVTDEDGRPAERVGFGEYQLVPRPRTVAA